MKTAGISGRAKNSSGSKLTSGKSNSDGGKSIRV